MAVQDREGARLRARTAFTLVDDEVRPMERGQMTKPTAVVDPSACDRHTRWGVPLHGGIFGHEANAGIDEMRLEHRQIQGDPVTQNQDRARRVGEGEHRRRRQEAR